MSETGNSATGREIGDFEKKPLAGITPEEFMMEAPLNAEARERFYQTLTFPEWELRKANEAWQRIMNGTSSAFENDEISE